jgi:hypothetical protein
MKKFFSSFLRTGMFGMVFAALSLTSQGQVSIRDINQYLKKRDDGKNVSMYHRYDLGYGVTFGSGALILNDRFRDQSNNNIISGTSRSTTFNYRTWTVHASTYFPLSFLSERSALVLNLGLLGVPTVFELGNLSLDPSRTSTYEAADLFLGIPVGVDYIFGGEATLNKADKFTLRAGGGLMPYLSGGELADGSNDYWKLGIKPYVKAELGFFAAVEWKIRGMAVLGSRTIYDIKQGDYNLGDSDYYYSMNFKIRPTFTIGIAVMPFSFGWESDRW